MTGQFNIKKFGFKLLQAAMLAVGVDITDEIEEEDMEEWD